ncbi:MAG: hypothetical protein H7Z19_04865, partial [Chitinophagaceae bacterium]|nr:hypothetical protein [Rubrivivax sp.]
MNTGVRVWQRLALAAVVACMALAGCGKKDEPAKPAAPGPATLAATDFVVLATSDLRDVQALEDMVFKATGVRLRFKFGGTMESTQAVLSGEAQADAAWCWQRQRLSRHWRWRAAARRVKSPQRKPPRPLP